MNRSRRISLAAVAALMAVAAPAWADVEKGVDAWSRGDFAAAVGEWQPAAEKGNADAQYNLGQAYMTGRGVPQDTRKAEYYYAKAAAQGHLQAADNYGLLLFQDGRRNQALPYLETAAERGDPRAQYLLGIGHFNGDIVKKDWIRAYALVSLANAQGLPQAPAALAQMDNYIPLAQRQAAASLATSLQVKAEETRAQQIASAKLAPGNLPPNTAGKVARAQVPPSAAASGATLAEPLPVPVPGKPAEAGADFARPAAPARTPAGPSAKAPAIVAKVPLAAASPAAGSPAAGPWKVQLGAFSVAGNAERLWNQVGGKGVLTGKTRIIEPAGKLTKLLAGGFESQSDAAAACAALKRAGQGCLVTR